MSGWIAVIVIAATASIALAFGGVSRSLWSLIGAALLLAAAGYALQGRGDLRGHAVAADSEPVPVDQATIDIRGAMLGRFSGDGAYLVASDALMRRGSRDTGANVVLLGLSHYPRSLTLWTGLGTALAQHDGSLSPAARLAFDQATRLAPDHPAPPFFRGQAYLESGDLVAARHFWKRALALSPRAASYRRDIALRLVALDMALSQQGP